MTLPGSLFTRLLRARHPCISITTDEEEYAVQIVVEAATRLNRPLLSWSVVRGVTEGLFNGNAAPEPATEHAAAALRWWTKSVTTRIMLLCDLPPHLDNDATQRAAREAIAHARATGSTLVMIGHTHLPDVIAAEAMPFEIAAPDDQELARLAKETIVALKLVEPFTVELTNAEFMVLVRHLRGLSRSRIAQIIREVALTDGKLDRADIEHVVILKRRLMSMHGLLEPVDSSVKLADVAGVAQLKTWLAMRSSPAALRDTALEPPRGILVLGVPGTGKSLCAKAIANAWNRPLMRLDAGVLYDRYVGESESRLRRALAQAEALAPVVLWIDEIEKAFASAAAQSTDGGLSQRLFGHLLTWMQERRASVFVIATANSIDALPAELLRKGRFDEIFFVDLPDLAAREHLFRIHLTKRGRDPEIFPISDLALAAEGRSGTEIEQLIISAIYAAHADATSVTGAHLFTVLSLSPPLSTTMKESIDRMRSWANGRCVVA